MHRVYYLQVLFVINSMYTDQGNILLLLFDISAFVPFYYDERQVKQRQNCDADSQKRQKIYVPAVVQIKNRQVLHRRAYQI